MRSKIYSLFLCILFLVVLAFTAEAKIKVATTNYPLGFLAKSIGGEEVELVEIAPPGIELHEFRPSAKQIHQAMTADLLLYLGFHQDPWVDKVIQEKSDKKSRLFSLEGFCAGITGRTPCRRMDPHLWLDPMLAAELAQRIETELVALSPLGKAGFQSRLKDLVHRLKELDQKIVQEFMPCEKKTIITTHHAFGYFGAKYGIEVHSVFGLSTEQPPSPKRLMELVRLIQKEGLSVIFKEPMAPERYAEVLASETGAEISVIYPLGSLTLQQARRGDDYFGLMLQNLSRLKMAMKCKDGT